MAAAVLLTSGKPAFVAVVYRGLQGAEMCLPKLRTMTVVNPRRVTVVGRLLRGSRLDELPTLVALARGDLTLVGPKAQPLQAAGEPLRTRPGLLLRP